MRVSTILIAIMFLGVLSCKKVPITGRSQMVIIPEAELLQMSEQEYRKFLSEHKVLTGTADARRVQSIGNQIAEAVERYYRRNGMESQLRNFSWEFNLVEDGMVNAWCMPGGKVVFYTGILPVCADDDGLAIVMGHEVAHAVARHGNERMSQGVITQLGAFALSTAVGSQPEKTQQIFLSAFGAGATLGVLLPFSRKHESEADRLGLIFMAMAGFNPENAPDFWERMSDMSGGKEPPVFVSSHPNHKTRIKDLKAYIPVAKHYASQYANP